MDYCKNSECKHYVEDIEDIGYRVYDEKVGVCKLHNNIKDNENDDFLHNSKCNDYEPKLLNKIVNYISFK